MPRVIGWFVVATGAMLMVISLSQPFVPGALFVVGAIMLVLGVAAAFGAFEDLGLPDDDGEA